MRSPIGRLLACATVALCISTSSQAHEAPHLRVKQLRSQHAKTPHDLESGLNLAAMERRLGHFDRAQKVLDALGASPLADPRFHLQRGLIQAAAGHPAQAVKALTQAIAIAPSADAHLARARLHETLGQGQRALADYARACGLRPNVAAYFERGRLLARMGQFVEAAAVAREGLVSVGEALTLRRQLAEALHGAGQPLDAAVALWPLTQSGRSVTDLLHAAQLYDAANRPSEAMICRLHALASARARFDRRRSALTALALARTLSALGAQDEAQAVATPFVFATPDLTAFLVDAGAAS